MQFQVPQFIETEDRIVGPFTLRQFIYVAVAGGLSFLLYAIVQAWLAVIFSVLIFGIAFGFALVKINGRPLINYVVSAANYYWQPRTYVWQPNNQTVEKSGRALGELAEPGISLENIVAGLALKKVWQNLQTGTKVSNQQFSLKINEHYQIVQKLTGERRSAKRMDYR